MSEAQHVYHGVTAPSWPGAIPACLRAMADSVASDTYLGWTDRDQALVRAAADEIERLTEDRDLAIAHDRQPYPTAWAYEKVCEVLHKTKAEALELRAEKVALTAERNELRAENMAMREMLHACSPDAVADLRRQLADMRQVIDETPRRCTGEPTIDLDRYEWGWDDCLINIKERLAARSAQDADKNAAGAVLPDALPIHFGETLFGDFAVTITFDDDPQAMEPPMTGLSWRCGHCASAGVGLPAMTAHARTHFPEAGMETTT